MHFYLNLSSFLFSLLLQWQMLLLFSDLGVVEPFFPEPPRVLRTTLIEFKNEDFCFASAFVGEPVSDNAIIAEELLTETMVEESAVEVSQVEEVLVEEDLSDEPVIEEPVFEEPVIDEPVIKEPVFEEPVIKEPVIDEPVIEELVTDEPVIEEIVTEELEEEVLQSEYAPEPDWLKNLQRLAKNTSDKTNLQTPDKKPDLPVSLDQQKELKQQVKLKQKLENNRTPETDKADSEGSWGIDKNFINLLRRRVLNCRRYPDAASRNRRAGVVELELQIGRDGVIKKTRLVKGSGNIILDEAALSISACIGKLPAIAEEIWVSVPVHYQMRYAGRGGR